MQGHLKSFSFISLILAAALVFFASCSQNTPELYSSDYSVIFDYADQENPPVARLSVFAASGSDVRRYQKIKITSVETGYTWETEVISMLDTSDVQWAGCTNIAAPSGEKLPTGKYELTYYNADEKEYSLSIQVRYDADLYEVLLPGLAEFMEKNRGIEKIAIYDKQHLLIYFGNRTSDFRTTRDIWNFYRDAASYQVIWYSRNGSVICIAPELPVSPEADEEKAEAEKSEDFESEVEYIETENFESEYKEYDGE